MYWPRFVGILSLKVLFVTFCLFVVKTVGVPSACSRKGVKDMKRKGVYMALSGFKRAQSIQCSRMRWMYLYLSVQFGSSSLDEHMLEQRDTTETFATVPIEK